MDEVLEMGLVAPSSLQPQRNNSLVFVNVPASGAVLW